MSKTSSSLWHPKYWLTWLFIALMQIVVLLPDRILIAAGRKLGKLLLKVAKRRRHITETNVELCYSNLSNIEQQQLVKAIFEENTIGFIEALMAWLKPHSYRPMLSVDNEHLLQDAIANDRGLLLVGAHYTTIDICGRLLGQRYPFNVLYRPQNNPVINYIMEKGRNRHLQTPAINQHDFRRLVSTLKTGGVLWFPYDQDHGSKSSVFAPFFGVNAATLAIPSRLVKLTNCDVIFCHHYRTGPGKYHASLEKLTLTVDNLEQDALLLNKTLEEKLRKEPSQYMWVHRRFKTRPKGEASLY